MKPKKQASIHVGTLGDMGQRFTSAWRRAAAGSHTPDFQIHNVNKYHS
ncbi:MAG: hypothetical protein U1F72_04075 [Gammaproteobacteria bacterium]